MAPSKLTAALVPLLLVTASVSLFVGTGEVVLRLFPVSSGQQTSRVNETTPLLRYEPHTTSTWSFGWNFRRPVDIRTNNYGFISDRDYDSRDDAPLLAVIGDSYIEARMVQEQDRAATLLDQKLQPDGRCYSFAMSGSPLSQYLAYAQFARDTFRPRGLAVLVVGNDFDESLLKYRDAGGFHYFRERDGAALELVRTDLDISAFRETLRHSMLFQYTLRNLHAGNFVSRILDLFRKNAPDEARFVGNTSVDAEPTRIADSQRAVDTFLDELPSRSGLGPRQIVVAVDARRPQMYTLSQLSVVEDSYFSIMRRYLLEQAERR
ncbi:MAG: hypothetical protein IT290_06120, partial [Deltaproteobacteria bacterium]|nr:hypothetical protein [Deltaproteobacteria bacterium]